MDNFDVKVTRRTRYTIRFNIYNKEYILKDRGKIKRDIDLVKHIVVETLIGIVIGALLTFFLLYIYTVDSNTNNNVLNNNSAINASTKYIYIDKEDHVAYITLSNIDKDIN
jgi:hypothetical protein